MNEGMKLIVIMVSKYEVRSLYSHVNKGNVVSAHLDKYRKDIFELIFFTAPNSA